MEKREPDTSGDYGYDLVHESVGAARPPARGSGADDAERAARSGDQDGDYGYDEAHDF
ncbi:hypothetical protein GCM10010531_19620 [Blastococcus jejuensis]|uniref:Uncharacterized protein n=1 Tax=Blastococcus jejuensis TaxID=351224 RepID=A0ABP6P4A0_9ACTN